jgi:hypothetical protein
MGGYRDNILWNQEQAEIKNNSSLTATDYSAEFFANFIPEWHL